MNNRELASLFTELADIMEIAGESHFKIRSYRKAAANIVQLQQNASEMSADEIIIFPESVRRFRKRS